MTDTRAAPFTAALVQMRCGGSTADNLVDATKLIRAAKAAGADYVLTPEMTNLMVVRRDDLFSAIADEETDATLQACRALARELALYLHIGSLAVRVSKMRAANRSFLIGPDGSIVARYDKIHMFDVDLAHGESYRESASYQAGETAIIADLPWGRIGLSICYDLRFPAVYRALAEAGAAFLTVPSAFTRQTGEAHWHTLLRARAIENGCYVFAAAQGGLHATGRETYGHSLIVDPWGTVIAEGDTEPGIVVASIDPARVTQARQRIPSLQHGRRFSLADPRTAPDTLHVVRRPA